MKTKEKIYEMYKEGQLNEKQAFKLLTFAEDMEKSAISWGPLGTSLLQGLAVGGGATLAGVGINKLVGAGDNAFQNQAAKAGYDKLKIRHPELFNGRDEDSVKDIYFTLAKFAPSLASDTNAAAGYVQHILDYGRHGANHDVIKTLVDLEKSHQQAKALRTDPSGVGSDFAKSTLDITSKSMPDV